jgi:hypothetical protein
MQTCELPPPIHVPAPPVGPNGRPAGQVPHTATAEGPSPFVRWARLIALAVGGFLLPWSVFLAVTLPADARAQHWWLAWAGLDGAEAAAALATAVLLARHSARASLTAAAGAALLLVDAWFDVCTSSPGLGQGLALAEAICAELPLAGAAIWLAITLTRKER